MSPPNPAAAFYASHAARALTALLRAVDARAPRLGTRLALRLFLTPMPTKWRSRGRPVPSPWQLHRLPFEGSEIAVWRHPDDVPDAPRVLLVHGWAGDASQMLALAEGVRAAGLAPLLVDLPAHGRSGGWRSNLVQWSRALFAVSSRFGPWQGGVGHSLGARALAHALAQGLPVQRAAFIGIAPPPNVFLRWFAGALGLRSDLAERMARRIEQREGMALQAFEPAWIGPRLPQPTLLVHDSQDRSAPIASGEQLAAALPQASLLRTEGLGHRRVLADLRVVQAVATHLRGGEAG